MTAEQLKTKMRQALIVAEQARPANYEAAILRIEAILREALKEDA